METLTKVAIVALIVFTAIGSEPMMANGQQDKICGMKIDDIKSCKPALTDDLTSKPPTTCCSALQAADVPCLCSFMPYLPSLGIDPDHAMQLPGRCKLPNAKSFHC